MRVHVTLAATVASDAGARRAALRELLRASGMSFDKPERFERYGIVSGDAPAGRLAALRGVPGVVAVETDEEEHV